MAHLQSSDEDKKTYPTGLYEHEMQTITGQSFAQHLYIGMLAKIFETSKTNRMCIYVSLQTSMLRNGCAQNLQDGLESWSPQGRADVAVQGPRMSAGRMPSPLEEVNLCSSKAFN